MKPTVRCSMEDIKQLSDTFGPATLILLCKNFVYVAVTVSLSLSSNPKDSLGYNLH